MNVSPNSPSAADLQYQNLNGFVQTTKTLVGNNATVAVPLFRVTGTVYILRIWAIVTTVLGANVTAGYLRLNDQTAPADITLAAGSTLSAAAAGTFLAKTALAASAITVKTATAGKVGEAGTADQPFFQEFTVQKKPAANTDIEFVYSTTDTPTSGAIQFMAEYRPISADGALVAL